MLVQGLPVHPLVVHAAVVFVPLAALGLLLMVLVPRFGARFGWLISLTGLVGLGAAYLASESGEQLEELVGEPGYDHARWGDQVPVLVAVLLVASIGLWVVQRLRQTGRGTRMISVIAGVLAAVVAVLNLFWMYQAGHSGAASVWKSQVNPEPPAPTPTPSPTPTPTLTPTLTPAPTDSLAPTVSEYPMTDVPLTASPATTQP